MKPKATLRHFLALAGSSLMAISSASAQSTWSGSTSNLWSGANWDTTPANGNALIFSGTNNQANTNDAFLTNIGLLTLSNAGWNINLGTLTLNGGITANGTSTLGGTLTLGAAQTWQNSTGILTVTGTMANGGNLLTIGGAGNTSMSSVISGLGGLTKTGAGSLTLTGANGYTGTTTIDRGALTLNRATGALSSSSALTFSGTGTFNMDNTGATGALTQALGALTFSAGQGTVQITRTAAFDQAITFASLAARTAGASGNFVHTGGTNSATNGIIFTSAPTAGTLIDRGIFFNGSSYATYDLGGFVRAYGSGDTNYSSTNTTIANDSTKNVELTGAITGQTTAAANTINMGANSITMGGTSQILSTNGLLSSGSNTAAIGGGTTPLLQAGSAGGELVLRVNGSSDILTVSSGIQNNTSASRLTKSGDGTLILTGNATYTGVTAINSGTLQLGNGGATGTISSSSTIVNNGSLVINHTSAQTLGVISSTGSVTMSGTSGTNALTLSNSNSFSGGFTLTSGIVGGIASGTYNGFGTGTFTASNGTLNFNGGSTQTINNALSWGGGNLVLTRSSGTTPNTTWTGPLTLTGNQTLTLGASTTANNSTFTNNISGDFGLIVAGPTSGASLTLSGANNTFSGGLTMNSSNVALNINSSTALGTGTFTITAAGAINNTSGGAITLANNNALAINSNFTFTGSNDLNMGTEAVNLGAGTRQITTTAGILTLGGVISNGGITKLGAGTLVLSGTSSNTYGTITTVSAGTLELNKTTNATRAIAAGGVTVVGSTLRYAATAGDDQITDAAAVTLANGAGTATLNLNGISDTIGSLTIGGTSGTATSQGVVTTGAGTLTLGGNLTYTSTGNSTVTSTISGKLDLGSSTRTFAIGDSTGTTTELDIQAAISGTSVGLTKTGAGTMQLTGANTYTGTTTLTQGILSLDFTNGNNRINNGNALTLNGGTLQFTNLGTNTQTFGTTTLTAATASSITRSGIYTSGVSDLGTLSGTGTLDVSNLSGSPTWIKASGNVSQAYLLNGLVTANSGANLVKTDASGNLLSVTTSDFANNAIIGNNAGTSIRLVAGGSAGSGPTGSGFVGLSTIGTTDFDSISNRYTTGTVTIDVTNSGANASNVLRMGSYGLTISTSGAALTVGASVANGGILTAGGADNTAGSIYVNGSNDTTINSAIQNNGTGVVGLNKAGSGVLTVAGASTFTGGLVVNAGILRLTNASNVITGGITLNGGTLGDNTGAISTATLNNNLITVNGAASLGMAASTTTNGGITLNTGSNLTLGTNGSAFTVNGAVTGDGSISINRLSSGGHSQELNSTANTFTGTVSFTGGATLSLSVNSLADSASLGAGNIRFAVGAGTSAHTFALGSGAIAPLTLNNRRIELVAGSSAAYTIANNSSQAFTINTDLLVGVTGSQTLTLGGTGSGLSSFNGKIENGTLTSLGFTKSGTGTWVLGNSANTYTGTTQISDGRLVINSIAALGAGSSAIILGNSNTSGTLEYTGAEVSTSRTFQIGTNNNAAGAGGILNNGTGTLTFTNATFNQTYAITHAQTRTLTLGGTNDGVIQGTIQNSSGTVRDGIAKVGSGTWTLGGNNSYIGSTTLNAGTLKLNYDTGAGGTNSSKLSNTATYGTLLLNGGTLELSGGSHLETVLSTTLTAGTSFVKQTGGTSTLSMGGITFTSGAIDFSAASIATTTTGTANTLLSQRATVAGANFAMKDAGNTNIVAYNYATNGSTGYTGAAMSANINYELTANGVSTLAGITGATTNTLKIANTSTGSLAVGANTLTTGAILFAGSANYDLTTSGSGMIIPGILHNYGTGGAVLNLGALGGALNQYGTGTTVLTAAAQNAAGVNVYGGTVQISTNAQIGTPSSAAGITLNNGTLLSTAAVTLDNGGVNSRNVTLGAGGGTLAATTGNSLTVTGVISGTASQLPTLNIGSATNDGTVTLTGANSYSGATTITAGTLDLGGATSTGSLASATLNLGGGTLSYTRTGTNAQSFTTTNLTAAGSTVSSTNGSNTLNLGNIVRSVGSTLSIGTTGTITGTGVSNTNGIIGGWVLADTTGWAVQGVIPGTDDITALASYTTTTSASTDGANYLNANMDVNNSAGTIGAAINTNSLRFNNVGANTVTLFGTGNNIIQSGGVLVTSSVGNNLSTITGGTLVGSASGELIIHQHNTSNSLAIGSIIADNGGATGLTKSGAGTLTLTGTNTYTGATTITGGSLALSGSGSIANSSTITINSSTSLNVTGLTGDFTVGASQSLGGSGTLTATGKTVIASGTLTPGNSPGTLTQDGGVLQLGVGGDLNWQVYDANAPAGIGGYDTVSLINGATLDLSALSAGNTYNINLWSLSAIGSDVNGNAIDFNNALNQAWTLFSTGTAITNFDTSKFTINTGAFNGTSGFTNTLNGSFNVALGDSNTDLVLTYTAIPEPRAALLGGLGMLLLLRRRRH